MPDVTGAAARSWWLEEALSADPGADAPPLEGTVHADICIVGGGYAGLWTALAINELRPSARVVVLEADTCGGAASGRNGGMALSWWPKIETLIGRVGYWEAYELAREAEQQIADIGHFCEREGIDAHFRQGGWLWTATSGAQRGAWEGALRLAQREGDAPFVELSVDEVRARLGSDAHLGGVLEPSAATVQPARLARGLRRVALGRGIVVHEHTPATKVARRRLTVTTPRGEVRAQAIVVATNAWAAQDLGLRSAIVPISSDVVATEPIPEVLAEIGWTGGESVSNSRLMVDYYRTTTDGRIVFGRGGGALAFGGRFGDRWDADRARAVSTVAALHHLVPAARRARITHYWGGAVDRSTDGLPFVRRDPLGAPIVHVAGFSGNGVAAAPLMAKIVAACALGVDNRWSGSGLAAGIPGRFPPEPVRYLGGRLVREAVRRKEERDDRGLRVDVATLRLAAMAPSGFFKIAHDSPAEDGHPGAPSSATGGNGAVAHAQPAPTPRAAATPGRDGAADGE